jgi:hypothetical protein
MDADLGKLPGFTGDRVGLFLFCSRFRMRGVECCKPTPGGYRAAPERGQKRPNSNHDEASITKSGPNTDGVQIPSSQFQPCRPFTCRPFKCRASAADQKKARA